MVAEQDVQALVGVPCSALLLLNESVRCVVMVKYHGRSECGPLFAHCVREVSFAK